MDRREFIGLTGGAATLALAGFKNGDVVKKPNIVLIMADDMGYSDLGCYGGEIDTPNLDKMAAEGIRFSQFYNGARCCPTRASLLTGLYAHQAGVGEMVDGKRPGPYQGYLNDKCITIAEALKGGGYSTYMTGKWHVGEERPNWPVDRGFDRYYGLISGAMNYFDITKANRPGKKRHFAKGNQEYMPPNKDWYATDAFTDYAMECIEQHDAGTPFFMYLAYTAPHWPLHALPGDIAKYRGKYKEGWAKLREQRHKRQIEMGLLEDKWDLSEQDPQAVDWDSLDDAKKDEMDLKMAVYAAQVHSMDRGVGRIMDTLKKNGYTENTLVMFLSDNGACAERGTLGTNFRKDLTGEIGTVDSYHSYGLSWASASNTPFRKYKSWVNEGGIATPFIAHWKGRIAEPGSITHQVGHIIDLMATCCDVSGTKYPTEYKGRAVTPTEGLSLAPIFAAKERKSHELLCWEHIGRGAARAGKWKLLQEKRGADGWALYDMEADRTELNNLIDKETSVAAELREKYDAWAARVGV